MIAFRRGDWRRCGLERLAEKGEGPCAFALRTVAASAGRALDGALAHQVEETRWSASRPHVALWGESGCRAIGIEW